jgi:hypothetical protein
MASFRQTFNNLGRCCLVVTYDGEDIIPFQIAVEHNNRHNSGCILYMLVACLFLEHGTYQNNAVHLFLQEKSHVPFSFFQVSSGIAEDHMVTEPEELLFQYINGICIVGVPYITGQNTDCVGGVDHQAPGYGIGPVIQFLQSSLHPFTGFGPDTGAVVDHPGNRSDGNTGPPGYFVDIHAALPPPSCKRLHLLYSLGKSYVNTY